MNNDKLYKIILQPHTSEKSTIIADKLKQFTFKVKKDATKKQITAAVKFLFKVDVLKVATINMKGKIKRFKQNTGARSDWKKAYVSIPSEQDIDFSTTES